MANTRRIATLRVVGDVPLGGGKFLPLGDYSGSIETMHLLTRGKQIDQIAKVQISLSEEEIASFLDKEPNPNGLGMDADFTPSFIKGDIVEV